MQLGILKVNVLSFVYIGQEDLAIIIQTSQERRIIAVQSVYAYPIELNAQLTVIPDHLQCEFGFRLLLPRIFGDSSNITALAIVDPPLGKEKTHVNQC